MEFYDSHETEQESKEFSKKVNAFLSNFKNMSEEDLRQFKEQIIIVVKHYEDVLIPLLEKAKTEKLSEEENKLFIETFEPFAKLRQGIEDMLLVLGNSLKMQADGIFFNIKQQAAKGDPKAKEMYEDLLPHYKETLLSDDIVDLN